MPTVASSMGRRKLACLESAPERTAALLQRIDPNKADTVAQQFWHTCKPSGRKVPLNVRSVVDVLAGKTDANLLSTRTRRRVNNLLAFLAEDTAEDFLARIRLKDRSHHSHSPQSRNFTGYKASDAQKAEFVQLAQNTDTTKWPPESRILVQAMVALFCDPEVGRGACARICLDLGIHPMTLATYVKRLGYSGARGTLQFLAHRVHNFRYRLKPRPKGTAQPRTKTTTSPFGRPLPAERGATGRAQRRRTPAATSSPNVTPLPLDTRMPLGMTRQAPLSPSTPNRYDAFTAPPPQIIDAADDAALVSLPYPPLSLRPPSPYPWPGMLPCGDGTSGLALDQGPMDWYRLPPATPSHVAPTYDFWAHPGLGEFLLFPYPEPPYTPWMP